jgi:hypothetical protein
LEGAGDGIVISNTDSLDAVGLAGRHQTVQRKIGVGGIAGMNMTVDRVA